MKQPFLLFTFVLASLISCKNDQKDNGELTKMSREQIFDMVIHGKNYRSTNAVYKSTEGKIISFDSVKKILNLQEDYAIDLYLNAENEITEMVLRPATPEDKSFIESLQKAARQSAKQPVIPVVDINCAEQTKILQEVLSLDQGMRNSGNIDPEIDRQNLATVISLIEQCGMPTAAGVGSRQMTAVWLVFQHADDQSRKKYFPLLREAAARGDLSKTHIAMMEDRILMNDGKPQRYGTQVMTDPETGDFVLYELEDPKRVNHRRAEVGFEPLQDYLQNWNIVFNIEQVQ